jgi:hypothetical protein
MKKYYLFFIIIFINIIIITGCKSSKEKEVTLEITDVSIPETVEEVVEEVVDATVEAPPNSKQSSDVSESSQENTISTERKLIKEADLVWEANNINKTHQSIIQLSKKFDAYIADDNQYKDDYTISNKMTVKVPAKDFDAFINSLSNDVNKFDRKSIKVLDVTEEYVDVATRIKTKKELEQRYIEILKHARNVEEILNVEAQLNQVRLEIEIAEGRMKMLNHQTTLSTINIEFYETTSAPVGFFGKLGNSFVEGWNGILYFILGMVRLWPLCLFIFALIYLIIKRRRLKINQRK